MKKYFIRALDKLFGKDSDHEIPRKELIKFSLGVYGQNNNCNLTGWIQYFCLTILGFNPILFSTLFAIVRVWDAVNDPIVGTIVDRHIFKNGEKLRPYISKLALPIGVLSVFMFIDYALPVNIHMGIILITYVFYDLLYSFQDVAQWGMTTLISTKPKERERAAQLGRIGALAGGWLPGLIATGLDLGKSTGFGEKNVMLVAAIVFGFGGMAISVLAKSARERVPVFKVTGHPLASFGLLIKNKIVMLVVLSSLLGSFTLVLNQVMFFQYMLPETDIFGIKIPGRTLAIVLGIAFGLPGTLLKPFTIWVSRRLGGMKNILIVASVFNISARVIAFTIGYDGWRLIVTGLCLMLANIPANMTDIATTALWGDSLDYIEWKTGKRNEGTVFSMQNAASKISGAIGTFFTGLTLTILQYDASLDKKGLPQPPTFHKWAWAVFILAPAFGGILHLAPLLFLRYNNKMKTTLETELQCLRTQKLHGVLDLEYNFELYDSDELSPQDLFKW
ncbi:MAG: MFS transporter [Christensenellaceae bacterium]|jgi:Na+/melibiose symporter-like transporter|nr:MFS transporter [Christensenellaceae bacterium]